MAGKRLGYALIAVLELVAFVGTFHLYGQVFDSVILAFVVVAGVGGAGLRALGRLSRRTGVVLGIWTFFAVQYGSALGVENTGKFGLLIFLSIGTVLVWALFRDEVRFFDSSDVDMDEWPGKDDEDW